MAKEITRYNNELNTVSMRRWTPEEQNFFFAILTQARDRGNDLMIFNRDDLIELANYSIVNNKRFSVTIENLVKKVGGMMYYERTSNSFTSMALFQWFKAYWSDDLTELKLEVEVSKRFDYILNKLEANFTQFELKQFTNIRSTYAKEMFKKLKQWRTVGKKRYTVEEFRAMLDVPKSYNTNQITTRVLAPITEELPTYFEGFKVTPIKSSKRGRPITAYEFTWTPEQSEQWDGNKYTKAPATPATKGRKTNGRKVKVEPTPAWFNEDPKADTPLPDEQSKAFNERLRLIRGGKQ